MVKRKEKDVVIKRLFFVGLLAFPRIFIRMGPPPGNKAQYPTLFSKRQRPSRTVILCNHGNLSLFLIAASTFSGIAGSSFKRTPTAS